MTRNSAGKHSDCGCDDGVSRRQFVGGAAALGAGAGMWRSGWSRVAAQGTPAAGAPPESFARLGDTQDATYPLTQEKVTFSIVAPSNSGLSDYETNEFTKWYEEKTNVHLDWNVVSSEEATTILNTMFAGGDYPELVMSIANTLNLNPAVQQLYGSQGLFVPLNEYIDTVAVEFKRVIEQYPLTLDVLRSTDGNIYSLPYVNDCFHCAMDKKLWIYRPWLDALGLAMPQTTEEYREVLRAFKDQDPNGNGEADELPLASGPSDNGSWNGDLDLFFMNSYIYNPGEPWLTVPEGKVTAVCAQPEWQEGIRYLASLYAEGLIAPESFTQSNEELLQLGNDPAAVRIGSAPGGSWGVFVQWVGGDPSLRWAGYELVPPLQGPNGVRYAAYDPYLPYFTGNFVITDKCKDPELAFRWADGLYDQFTTMRSVLGIVDKNWRWPEEGELGVDGQPGIWAGIPADPDAPTGNDSWVQTGPSFRSSDFRFGEVVPEIERPYNLDLITREVMDPYKQPAEWTLPKLFFSADESREAAEIEATFVPFVKESFARFITGEDDIEGGWEDYLSTLEGMGLSRYVELHQKAYDAKQGG